MVFDGKIVSGSSWVEILNIRHKDGSPLAPDDMRQRMLHMVTLCWIAGGLTERTAFFKGDIRMDGMQVQSLNLSYRGWCSTTTSWPEESSPGIFDFETNTCIYRFRILSEKEALCVMDAIGEQILKEIYAMEPALENGGGVPVS